MGSEHRKGVGIDSWMSPDVDTPLMSLRSMFSTDVCENWVSPFEWFTAQERYWYVQLSTCEVSSEDLIEQIVNEVVFHEREV